MGVMSKNAFILSRLWSLSPQVTRLYTPFPFRYTGACALLCATSSLSLLLRHPDLATHQLQRRPAMDECVPGERRLALRALPLPTSARSARLARRASLRQRRSAGEQAGRVLADAFDVALDEAALHAVLLLVPEEPRAAALAWGRTKAARCRGSLTLPWRDGRLAGRCQSAATAASSAARRRGHSSRLQRAAWASGRAPGVRGGWAAHGRLPGRVDDAALHSTATVWYESTAAPRFGAASIRILMPGGAGTTTVGRRAQLSGVDGGCDASLRTSPGGEGIGGRLTDSCSVLLSRAQANRNRALVGAREAIRRPSCAPPRRRSPSIGSIMRARRWLPAG